ncbi:hypothetical protein BHV06_07475 [Campylobacter jejuni]|nr:hypothetical protein [Campylobacter jejuni]
MRRKMEKNIKELKMKLQDFDFRIWSYNIEEYLQPKNTYLAIVKDEKGLDSYEKVLDVADDCSGHDYPLYQYGDSADVEVELFTGLYDKNGKKIYEGDIVSYITFQGTTLFYFVTINKDINIFEIFRIANLEKFELYNRTENDRFSLYLFSKINDMKDIEVIGNIHNKAELLEVKEQK